MALENLGTKLFDTLFSSWLGVLRGGLSMALSLFKNTLNAAFNSVKSFNQMGVNTSRAIGLGYRDSIAYTQTLINRTQRLSALYGVTADKIAAIQDSLAKATGRAIMLSNAQAEYATAINKMVGDGVLEEYQKNIIRTMGGSVDAAQKAVIGAYAKATRSGLAAAEFSSKVAQNLSLANKVTFRGGIDGITKMTALSERLGFNLQSIEASAQAFNDIQGAVEGAAKLQALGGGAALYGSNPLAMMYEAMYDMESYTERITKMVKGMAVFNEKTGIAEVGAQNKEFIRHYAEILKIPYEDLYSMATNQAKEAFAKNRLGSSFFDNLAGGDEEFKSFIMNKAQWNDKKQKFEITLPGQEDNPIDLEEVQARGRVEELKKAWRDSTLTETEAFLQGARDITSVDERIAGIMSVVGAMLADKLMPYLEIASIWLSKAAPKIASVIGNGFSLLLTGGFWRNIGMDFFSILMGGLTLLLQTYLMSVKFGPLGAIVQILGGIAHAVGWLTGSDILKGVGKFLDGTMAAELVTNTIRNADWFKNAKDENALVKQKAFLNGASDLVSSATNALTVAHDLAKARERGEARDYGAEIESLSRRTQSDRNDDRRFRVTALRAIGDIRENTRNTYTGINDLHRDNTQYAQAQIDALDNLDVSPTAANQNVNPRVYDEMGTSYASMLDINGNTNKVGGSGGSGGMLGGLLGLYGLYKFGKMGLKLGFGVRGGRAVAQAASGGKPKLLATIGRQVGSGIKSVGTNVGNTLRATNLMFKANRYGTKLGPALTKTFSDARMLSRIDPSFARGARIISGFGRASVLALLGMAVNKITDKLVKPEDYGSLGHYAGRIGSTALEGAALGSMIGGPVIGGIIGGIGGGIYGLFRANSEKNKEKERQKAISAYNAHQKDVAEQYAQNGFMGVTYVPYGNEIMGMPQPLGGNGDVVAAPVGGSEYIYQTTNTQTQNNGQNTIKVSDITVKVNGTIKLEGNGSSAQLDVENLLKDRNFVRKLVEVVFDEQNLQANNGRMKMEAITNRYATGMGLNSFNAPIS